MALGLALIPLLPWWGSGLIIVGGAAIAVYGLQPLFEPTALTGWGYISLARAAAKYYGLTRNSSMAQAAEGGNASPNKILNWYAYWLVQHGVHVLWQATTVKKAGRNTERENQNRNPFP